MPTYLITSPDGRKFRVTGDGSQEEALQQVQAQYQPQTQTEQPPPAEAEQPSAMSEVGRQLALTGRAATEGVVDVASIFANPVAAIMNAGLKALGVDYKFPEQSGAFSQALTDAGVATPQSDTEQLFNSIGRRAVGTAATMGAGAVAAGAPGATGAVGTSLASNPAIQLTAASTGPISREVAKEAGAGPVGQAVADLAGSIAPGVAAAVGPATTRASFRGGEAGRQRAEQNVRSFARAGTAPSVGQATESRMARGTESLLSRAPGGSGPIVRKAESQADDLAVAIERRASQLARKTTGEQAGRQIQRSISGEGGFVDKFKAQQATLYDELDRFIPASQRIGVERTQAALKDLNQNIEGAENVSKFFQNSKIKGIESALSKDIEARPELDDAAADILDAIRKVDPAKAQAFQDELFRDGKLPYEAVKKLRTLVGREMADAGIASDVPRSKWKALYAALSDDLGQAVQGNAGAKAAWTRANNYTKAGMRRIEAVESVLDRNGGPEAVFRAATSGTKEGATTLRAVMQSVDDEGRKIVSATVLRRLGIAKAGVQGELGDKFSTETFLTNWNLLSREAKRTLFDRYGPNFRADMDAIAKVAANLREGSQVFRNPSGTAQATGQAATVGGLAASLITGNLGAAGTIGGGVLGANLSARLMTNPRFVRWLAQTTKMPQGTKASAINSLAKLAEGDEDIATAVAALEHEQKQTNNQGNRKRPDQ